MSDEIRHNNTKEDQNNTESKQFWNGFMGVLWVPLVILAVYKGGGALLRAFDILF